MGLEPITDHNKMLTETLCRSIFRYILENPSVTYSEVVRVLANVQYAVGLSLDHWYAELVQEVGYDVTERCEVPELHNFLEWPVDDTDWDIGVTPIDPEEISTDDLEFDLDNGWDPEEDLDE